jgi:hypothetical protein
MIQLIFNSMIQVQSFQYKFINLNEELNEN